MRDQSEQTNCFHEYMKLVTAAKNMSLTELRERLLAEDFKVARQWTWETSNRPTLRLGNRVGLIEAAAEILGEPLSRLAFLAGMNPWANRLSLAEQGAVWEFVEAIVTAKEAGMAKPPPTRYTELMNTLFGGAKVVNRISNEDMAALLRGEADE